MFYTYMEDFLSIPFILFTRTYVRETKAKLSFRTPNLHHDDKLCVRFKITIRNMREWISSHFSRVFT